MKMKRKNSPKTGGEGGGGLSGGGGGGDAWNESDSIYFLDIQIFQNSATR